MIFVTIGGLRAFDRLIQEMDRIAGESEEKVVMQIGPTSYVPNNCDYYRFMSKNEIVAQYSVARVIVCHAGVGSILTAMEYNKPFILVPRMKNYREVFDDHQLEIAKEMQSIGVIVAYDIQNLELAIKNTNIIPIRFGNEKELVHRLKDYLQKINKDSR